MRHRVLGRESLDGLEAGHEETVAAATTATIDEASAILQDDWRDQIVAAGLGPKLARTIRRKTYPTGRNSVDAAALIWTKAPKIIGAYADGATIRPLNGKRWLWIPTEEVPKKRQGNRLSPSEVADRFGRDLDIVNPGAPNLRHTTTRLRSGVAFAGYYNLAIRKGSGRWRNATRGEIHGTKHRPVKAVTRQFVVMFILVPMVRVRKRLDLDQLQVAVDAAYGALLTKNWR